MSSLPGIVFFLLIKDTGAALPAGNPIAGFKPAFLTDSFAACPAYCDSLSFRMIIAFHELFF